MTKVNVEEAQKRLGDLIEAAVLGEDIVITQENHPVVKLVPVEGHKPRPMFGSAKGLITLADDFDEPLEEFEEYMG